MAVTRSSVSRSMTITIWNPKHSVLGVDITKADVAERFLLNTLAQNSPGFVYDVDSPDCRGACLPSGQSHDIAYLPLNLTKLQISWPGILQTKPHVSTFGILIKRHYIQYSHWQSVIDASVVTQGILWSTKFGNLCRQIIWNSSHDRQSKLDVYCTVPRHNAPRHGLWNRTLYDSVMWHCIIYLADLYRIM